MRRIPLHLGSRSCDGRERCASTKTAQNSDIVSPDSSFSTRHSGVAGACLAHVLRTWARDCLTVFISDEDVVEVFSKGGGDVVNLVHFSLFIRQELVTARFVNIIRAENYFSGLKRVASFASIRECILRRCSATHVTRFLVTQRSSGDRVDASHILLRIFSMDLSSQGQGASFAPIFKIQN